METIVTVEYEDADKDLLLFLPTSVLFFSSTISF